MQEQINNQGYKDKDTKNHTAGLTKTDASSSRVRSLVYIALFAAMVSATSLIAAFVHPIPFTLQTLFVGLAVLLLTPLEATGAFALYVAIGAVGIPVYAGGRGGLEVLFGPTGGFLFGFIAAAFIGSLIVSAGKKSGFSKNSLLRSVVVDVVALLAAMVAIYILGTLWLSFGAGMSLPAAFAAGVLPFIIPDLVKAGAALALGVTLRRFMKRESN